MLDPMTALGLAGNIVQFVDFSTKLVGKAHEIHSSIDGTLAENLNAETVAQTLMALQSKLRADEQDATSFDDDTGSLLKGLCKSCDETARELLVILEAFKIQGKRTPWKSMRHAIKSVRGKGAVLEISQRLNHFRELLEMTILVELRKKIDTQLIANSTNFDTLEASTQSVIVAVNENRSVFATIIEQTTAELKELHHEESTIATLRHEDVKASFTATVSEASQAQMHEHQVTRQELAERAAADAVEITANMKQCNEEIKNLIKLTHRARGNKERKQLKEKTNAATASLVAMDMIYNSLIGFLAQTNPKQPWKITPYPDSEFRDKSPGDHGHIHRTQDIFVESSPSFGSTDSLRSDISAISRKSLSTPATNYTDQQEQLERKCHLRRPVSDHQHRGYGFEPKPITPDPGKKNSASVTHWDSFSNIPVDRTPLSRSLYDWRAKSLPATSFSNYPNYSPTGRPQDDYHYAPTEPHRDGSFAPQQWAPIHYVDSDPLVVGDPETEKKLMAIEEKMKSSSHAFEIAQKEIAARDAFEALEKKLIKEQKGEKINKEAFDALIAAEKREEQERGARIAAEKKLAAFEKEAWEKRLAEEKRVAQQQGVENFRKKIQAENYKAEEKAAKEKAIFDAAAVGRAEKDRKDEIEAAVRAAREEILDSIAEQKANEESKKKQGTFTWPPIWGRSRTG